MLESFSFDKKNNAIVVALELPSASDNETDASVEELELLAKTLGLSVKKIFIQKKSRVEPEFFIGRGKIAEIKKYVDENTIDAVLFDNELSGIQERNIEKFLGVTIFSRTEIILNIFNRRAKTNEAKLQVQYASLEYMLPRLRNRWDHFSRVEGGIGMRGGEGEKQIELDKRMVKNQMSKIKERLLKVDVQMKNKRKKRFDANQVSLVGYTNAGKTSLLNVLAKTSQVAQNMLFTTLDSTVRKVYINDDLTILLNDTVGFINKLPHSLVASFKSTLDEILNSKLLLHIIDSSSKSIVKNIDSVNRVLEEIGANNLPVIRIFNKTDLLQNGLKDIIIELDENDLFISVKEKTGMVELKEKISDFFKDK
jgi:GTP-binding protein HflX